MKSGQYVILKAKRPQLGDAFATVGPMMASSSSDPGDLQVDVEDLSSRDLAMMREDPDVQGIAPAMPVSLIEPKTTNGHAPTSQGSTTWGVKAVKADQSGFDGQGAVVSILDTGIDKTHDAFQGMNLIVRDFTGEGASDTHGHGTHCAGTAFGRDVNGMRIGVAPGVQTAVIGKVLGKTSGSTVSIYQAILWAIEQGANVISMSLGIDFPGYVKDLIGNGLPVELATSTALDGYRANVRLFDTLAAMVRARTALGRGTLIVAAAGNESQRDINPNWEIGVSPPAAAEGIMSVGAIAQSDTDEPPYDVADFSNTGPNITAPGVDVQSAALDGGLVSWSGTSMATPHVAGVAALWAQKLLTQTGRLDSLELASRVAGQARMLTHLDAMDVGAGLVQAPMN